MAKLYRIVRGSFRQHDGRLLSQGQTIELDDDVAAEHAARLELVAAETAEPLAGPEAEQDPA